MKLIFLNFLIDTLKLKHKQKMAEVPPNHANCRAWRWIGMPIITMATMFYGNLGENQVYMRNGRRTKEFNKSVCWELPASGTGYITYKRNDLKKDYPLPNRKDFGDDYGYDQIGTKETVEAMMRIAREWSVYPQNKDRRKLQIGDMSRPGGINTPDHGGHDNGNIVDMRPLRNDAQTGDGANLNYNSPSYHRDLTKEFIRMVRKLYPNIYIRFNDGEIAGQGEFTYVHKDSKGGRVHNDHLHLEFR